MIISTDCGLSSNSPPTPRGGKGAPAGGTGGGKDGQHTEVGSRLHVTTTDSRTGQISLGDGGGHRLASWTSGYATARSEAICRGAGCGRTRTSGSVGGQGQQRPWSTRPRRGSTVSCRPPQNWLDTRDSCSQAMRSQRNPVRFTTAARATVEPSVAGPTRHPAAAADETP